ncbi:OsmC family protein [Uliginosibacterium sp. 31-16]|uniref:OsmC family protein n=1 Tax=Uliginosibacterium sp. 31-16 TaxID=3068315 RepID=UPI00273F31E1|nr:OsmC family protein [Uliginosibacterium sp. 31-16]MDP5241363.1 OsmC family protein [Uliginosibacterium sp. 31-16]
MECKIRWDGDARFLAVTGSGHQVAMEGAAELGGKDQAPRPMEMILAGAGGCTAYDVVLILKRGRHAITGCEVQLRAERAETDPKVFTRIHYHYVVSGESLKHEVVERAIKLSADKYCSASIMLGKTAEITHDFEIVSTPAA